MLKTTRSDILQGQALIRGVKKTAENGQKTNQGLV